MSDTAAAEAIDTTDADAADLAEDAAETEALARNQGWKPLDEFKGNPADWHDAKTHVERGKTIMPFLQANNRAMEKALRESSAKIERMEATLVQQHEFATRAEQRAYDRAKRELNAELVAFTAEGNVEGVKAVTDDLVSLEKEARAPDKPAEKVAKGENPIVTDWREANPWFDSDPALRGAAIELSSEFERQGITDVAKQLAKVSERIKAEFPHKFENPRRSAAAAVEGAGNGPRRGGKGWADLPPDAKAMADSLVRDVKGFTRDKYVKDYFKDAQ